MPVQKDKSSVISLESETVRVFAAPRALVFQMWTQAEHLSRWFAPVGVETAFDEVDARPGGAFNFVHRFEDRTMLRVAGSFQAVVPNQRLDFTHGFIDDHGSPGRHPMFPDWPLDAVIATSVLFADAERGTRVTLRQKVTTANVAAREVVERERRLASEGWTELFDRLNQHLQAISTGKQHAP